MLFGCGKLHVARFIAAISPAFIRFRCKIHLVFYGIAITHGERESEIRINVSFSFQFSIRACVHLWVSYKVNEEEKKKKWATKTRVAGAFSFKESWLLAAIVDHVMITAGEIGMVSISYASISHIHSKVSTVNALGFGFSLRKQQ